MLSGTDNSGCSGGSDTDDDGGRRQPQRRHRRRRREPRLVERRALLGPPRPPPFLGRGGPGARPRDGFERRACCRVRRRPADKAPGGERLALAVVVVDGNGRALRRC